jgi:hypothetical protein
LHFGAILLALWLYCRLSCLRGVPERIIHNTQLWCFLNDAFGCRIWARLTLTSFGVFDESLSIPNDPADLHLARTRQ